MRAAKNGFRLLELPFRLLWVKGEQLDRYVRPRRPDGVGRHSGGGSVHRRTNICGRKLSSEIVHRGGGRGRR